MNIDPKIWIAIAAVAAALLSATISLINMIISKDQKTTEFRQEWINSLRVELSDLLALAKSVRAQSNIISFLDSKPNREKEEEAINKLLDKVKNHSKDLNNSHTKILLFLNPKEHKKLIDLISTLVKNSNSTSNDKDFNANKQNDLIILESQEVLKTEWERVKNGERTFFLTKYLLMFLLLVGLMKIFGLIDVSFNLPLTP